MEPERHIEKLLRGYAKKRREESGAPLELHPATRRLLQGEVARRASRKRADSFFPALIAGLRRRAVLVSCFAVLVLIGTSLLMPALSNSKKKAQLALAQNQDLPRERAPASAPPPPAQPEPALDKEKSQLDDSGAGVRSAERLENYKLGAANADRNPARESEIVSKVPAIGGASYTSPRFSKDSVSQGIAELAPPKVLRQSQAAAPATSRPDSKSIAEPGQTTVAMTTGEAVPMKGADDKAVYRLSDSLVTATNAWNVVAKNGPAEFETAKKIGPTLGAVAESEATGTFALAGKSPGAEAPEVGGLVAAQKGAFEVAAGRAVDESAAFANSQRYAPIDAAANAQYRDQNIPAPVLASFQVQQSDQQIRVVDQDGSVYSGYWQPGGSAIADQAGSDLKTTAPAAPPPGQFQEKDARRIEAGQPAAVNYSFRVAGMNQSLKQNVVFAGSLTGISNGAPLIQSSSSIGSLGGGGFQNKSSNASLQLLLGNARVSGTAVIDNTKQIQINAMPAKP